MGNKISRCGVGWGCWLASSGYVTDEVWKKYIEGQKPDETDDDFGAL
jgi:putative transposase